jgi:hypothetical protein
MIRVILAFLVVFGLFYFGIQAIRSTTGKKKWELTKLVSYSIICATLTIGVLVALVIIF